MGKISTNQSGFSAVEGLLILVIVAIVGGTGWYVYSANKKTNTTYNAASQSSQSTASGAKLHTSDEAVTFTQKTYDHYLTAISDTDISNTKPLGLVGLAAVKNSLSASMYAKAAASHNGAAFSCAAQFVPSKYSAVIATSDKTTAKVALSISNSADNSTVTDGMTVDVNLASLKITAVTCPN